MLIAGARRLQACTELDIEPVYRVIDFKNPQQAEIDENTVRKDFTPEEIYQISKFYNEEFSGKPGPKTNNSVLNQNGIKRPVETVAEVVHKLAGRTGKYTVFCSFAKLAAT